MIRLLGFVFSYGTYDLAVSAWNLYSGWSLGLGYALGVLSTFIVMQAPANAVFAANGGKPVRMLGRFATLSPLGDEELLFRGLLLTRRDQPRTLLVTGHLVIFI